MCVCVCVCMRVMCMCGCVFVFACNPNPTRNANSSPLALPQGRIAEALQYNMMLEPTKLPAHMSVVALERVSWCQ